jgi:predicted AAA+ superfamily ATPase
MAAINVEILPSVGIITRMISRNLKNSLVNLLMTNAAVMLTGPRQIGKTTLAFFLQDDQKAVYRDMENPRELDQVREIGLFVVPTTADHS